MEKVSFARLEARLQQDIYNIIKQAAKITGKSVTEFVVNAAYAEATKSIKEHALIELMVSDQHKLINALSQDYEPNDAMKRAAQRHQLLLQDE
ncbi:DUF1778 domain-containing protein [Pelistega sp. NLN82]|uniref:DUF1778 domain-containing protein n=1 Tax=Pelistega ratti TaxID=2652177 RepID=A0A6L9Y6T7_9BURK|nr:DUF1778 domain-containing protein [Pelistega ratti]NEN76129.1 DUF1778 domain-containing protein [Pelistega ratti]